ncbi:MAG: DUF7695 domain-containing protein [Paraclostridium sp.]
MKRVEIACKKCGQVIWSRYPGDFQWCFCRSVAIDQNEYYYRTIGNREDWEVFEND